MTSGLLNSANVDFDSLFAAGTGTQTFNVFANDWKDVGQKYLPASMGDPGDPCGFLDASGNDIGPQLCKLGSEWTHAITVGEYHISSIGRSDYGYLTTSSHSSDFGSIVIKPGAFAATQFYSTNSTYFSDHYNWIRYWNAASSSYVLLNAPPSTVIRLDTGVSYNTGSVPSTSAEMFTAADVGKTVYFRVVYSG